MGASGSIRRFTRGAAFVGRGFSFVMRHRSLWPWVLMPLGLTALGATGLAWGTYWWAARLLPNSEDTGALVTGLYWAGLVLAAVTVWVVGFFVLSTLANAPFADGLSERTERLVTGQRTDLPFSLKESCRGIFHSLVAALVYLIYVATSAVVQLALPFLTPVVLFAGWIATAIFLAYDQFDRPLSRRQAAFREKWRYLARHRSETLGFGTVVAILTFLPGVGLLLAPIATVGATILYLDLESGRPGVRG